MVQVPGGEQDPGLVALVRVDGVTALVPTRTLVVFSLAAELSSKESTCQPRHEVREKFFSPSVTDSLLTFCRAIKIRTMKIVLLEVTFETLQDFRHGGLVRPR